MSISSKSDKQNPTFKIDDFGGLSREYLAHVCDIMSSGEHFTNMLVYGTPELEFDKQVLKYLKKCINFEFGKKQTAAIKGILAECYKPVWCHEIHDHMRSINILNVELCEKGDTKKALKKLTKSYKKLKKFMAKGGV